MLGKGVWRQRKTTADVSGEKDALTFLRLQLRFIPRKPPGIMLDQPTLGQVLQIIQHKRGSDPVALDPAARQSRS